MQPRASINRFTPPWRWLLLCLLLLVNTAATAEIAVPPLKSRVTDLSATLSQQQQTQLDAKLSALESSKGSQIAILLVPTTAPETIEQYGLRVAEQWKLGRKGVDDGLLIVAALQDRSLRLEVGYGLEGVVPDAIAKRVISEIMLPHFRQNDYYAGLVAGVDSLAGLIEGEPLPAPEPKSQQNRGADGAGNTLFMLIAAAVVLAGMMRAIFGQLLGATIVSTIIGVAAWMLFGSLIFTLIGVIFAFVLTLTGAGHGGGFGGMGGGGMGRSGGFGGGGFGGGGGGFGGGGASGRW